MTSVKLLIINMEETKRRKVSIIWLTGKRSNENYDFIPYRIKNGSLWIQTKRFACKICLDGMYRIYKPINWDYLVTGESFQDYVLMSGRAEVECSDCGIDVCRFHYQNSDIIRCKNCANDRIELYGADNCDGSK